MRNQRVDADMNNLASWIWVLIPLLAIGIAPFKMWLGQGKADRGAERASRPRRAPNMPSTWSGSKRGCGSSSRSPPTAASRPRRRSRRCGTQARIPRARTTCNEPVRVRPWRPDRGVRVQHHPAQDGHPSVGRMRRDARRSRGIAARPSGCARRSRSSRSASRCSSGSRSRKRTAWPRKSSRSATASDARAPRMAGLPALSEILEEYQLVDAEDRYRLLIDLGPQARADARRAEDRRDQGPRLLGFGVGLSDRAATAGCISSPTAMPRSPRASSR